MPVKRVKTCGNEDEMQKKGKQKGSCRTAVLNAVGLWEWSNWRGGETKMVVR
jgi:hypothetical protein